MAARPSAPATGRPTAKPAAAVRNMVRKTSSASPASTCGTGPWLRAPPSTSAPKPATATAPPSERKKLITPVAVPSWCIGTAFWIATVVTGSTVPTPMPTSASSSSSDRERQLDRMRRKGEAAKHRQRQAGQGRPLVVAQARHQPGGRGGAQDHARHQRDQGKARLAGAEAARALEVDRDVDRQADEGPHGEAGRRGAAGRPRARAGPTVAGTARVRRSAARRTATDKDRLAPSSASIGGASPRDSARRPSSGRAGSRSWRARSAPHRSGPAGAAARAAAGGAGRDRSSTARRGPSGRLIQKIRDQCSCWANTPPSTGPSTLEATNTEAIRPW